MRLCLGLCVALLFAVCLFDLLVYFVALGLRYAVLLGCCCYAVFYSVWCLFVTGLPARFDFFVWFDR